MFMLKAESQANNFWQNVIYPKPKVEERGENI